MLKDRGSIKWTAMMLPEHVAMLRELKEHQNDKIMPLIDEQQLEEFNEIIGSSIETKAVIKITYFKERDYKNVIGVIRHFDVSLHYVRIVTDEDTDVQIGFENIIDVKRVD